MNTLATTTRPLDALDDCFPKFINTRGESLSVKTQRIYGLSLKLLIEYIEYTNSQLVEDRYGKQRIKSDTEKWPLDPRLWTRDLFFAYNHYLRERPGAHGKPLSQVTRNTYFRSLQSFCTWVQEEYHLSKHPMSGFEMPKVVYKHKPTLTDDDFRRLVEAAMLGMNPERDVAILYLLLDTAVRRSEALTLQYTDIDWQERFIRVMGKGSTERTVPISNVALRMLSAYDKKRTGTGSGFFLNQDGTDLTLASFSEIIRRLERRAGVKANPHKFRHTSATRSAQNGIGAFHLQHMLGHKSLDITLRYIHMNDKDRLKAHDQYGPFARR